MKRKLGLTACYLSALVFPPLCGLLLLAPAGGLDGVLPHASFVGYEAAALAAMLLCGGCMVLHAALSGRAGGRPWPQILACALCGALALGASGLGAAWLSRRCPCGILDSTPCAFGCSFPAISSRTRCGRHGGGRRAG